MKNLIKNKKRENRFLFSNKKAEIPVTIALLVLLTVLLTGATLFIFNTNLKGVKVDILNPKVLDVIYVKEDLIDFYVNEMMDNAIKGVSESEDMENMKRLFIENFKAELKNYGFLDELKNLDVHQIEDNVDIDITNRKVFLTLNFKIEQEFGTARKMKVSYLYKKIYEKSLE